MGPKIWQTGKWKYSQKSFFNFRFKIGMEKVSVNGCCVFWPANRCLAQCSRNKIMFLQLWNFELPQPPTHTKETFGDFSPSLFYLQNSPVIFLDNRLYMHSRQCNCMHSYGIKGTLNPHSTPLNNETVPPVLKQVVNLSCCYLNIIFRQNKAKR